MENFQFHFQRLYHRNEHIREYWYLPIFWWLYSTFDEYSEQSPPAEQMLFFCHNRASRNRNRNALCKGIPKLKITSVIVRIPEIGLAISLCAHCIVFGILAFSPHERNNNSFRIYSMASPQMGMSLQLSFHGCLCFVVVSWSFQDPNEYFQ